MISRALTPDERVALAPPVGTRPPPLRLNLGCGTAWMGERIVNIDRRVLLPPEGATYLRGDIADLSDQFMDGACAELWATDVLEEFAIAHLGRVIQEWARLLEPGGILHLRTRPLFAGLLRPGDDGTIAFLTGLLARCGLVILTVVRATDGRLLCHIRKVDGR